MSSVGCGHYIAVREKKRSTTSWSTTKTACERCGQPSRRSVFSIVHFYFLSSPPGDAAHIPRVVHSLALLKSVKAHIRVPASRRTPTTRFPSTCTVRTARRVVASSLPQARHASFIRLSACIASRTPHKYTIRRIQRAPPPKLPTPSPTPRPPRVLKVHCACNVHRLCYPRRPWT